MNISTRPQERQKATSTPKPVLLGAAVLVGFTLISSATARLTDFGTLHMPEAQAVQVLSLRFEDQDNGAVAVRDTADSKVIYTVEPGTNGFIRSTLRGLVRERKRAGIGDEAPFALTHWNNGTLSIDDPATGRKVNLEVFGPTNAKAFADFFDARRRTQ